MKKILFVAMMLMALLVNAQNIQLHYDFGRHIYQNDESERQAVTATFEHFKADELGSWYYFIDLDFDKEGASAGYTEISREFNFAKLGKNSAFAAHVEYDGGLSRGFSYQSAALVGVAWNGHSADFSKTFSIQAMYKQFFGQTGVKGYASFQLTGVWGINFANNKCKFSGFMDLWRGKSAKDGKGCLVFLSEPQFWYNPTSHFSVGAEVELSNKFIYSNVDFLNDKFYVNPTLAVKYSF